MGYVARLESRPDDTRRELATIRWTLQALEVLAPDAFLLIFATAAAVSSPTLQETLGGTARDSILPALEAARVGRRRAELEEAVANARRLGLRLAITGRRVSSVAGFDSIVVSPRTAATSMDTGGKPLIVVDVDSEPELSWAIGNGAALLGGRAVGDPIKVAPVDLRRYRR